MYLDPNFFTEVPLGFGHTHEFLHSQGQHVFKVFQCEEFPEKYISQVEGKKLRYKSYTTWKVDGATPMYWFIMAPY